MGPGRSVTMTATPDAKREVFANPFFVVLMVASVVFVLTVLAYLISPAVLEPDPAQPPPGPSARWRWPRGSTATPPGLWPSNSSIMLVTGVLAMVTDPWFTRPVQTETARVRLAMARKEIEREVAQLRTELNRHNYLYYVEAKPEISDREYDRMMQPADRARGRASRAGDADSPTQRVGGQPLEGFATVRHAVPMLSIDNTYSYDELREWDVRVRKGLNRDEPVRYVVELKVDGVAVSLALRARQARAGRDPRRRRARRRHHGQPEDGPRDPAGPPGPAAPTCSRCAARST